MPPALRSNGSLVLGTHKPLLPWSCTDVATTSQWPRILLSQFDVQGDATSVSPSLLSPECFVRGSDGVSQLGRLQLLYDAGSRIGVYIATPTLRPRAPVAHD